MSADAPAPEPDSDRDETVRIVGRHLAQLSEHFDTVRVFVTRRVRTRADLRAREDDRQ